VAKKDSDSGRKGILHAVGGAVGTTVGSAVREALLDVTVQVSESAEALLLKIDDRTQAIQERFLNTLAAFLLMSLAVLFITLGAYFLLTENFGLEKAYVFGALGIILLIAALIYRAKSNKR
jgi:hypothetical protein